MYSNQNHLESSSFPPFSCVSLRIRFLGICRPFPFKGREGGRGPEPNLRTPPPRPTPRPRRSARRPSPRRRCPAPPGRSPWGRGPRAPPASRAGPSLGSSLDLGPGPVLSWNRKWSPSSKMGQSGTWTGPGFICWNRKNNQNMGETMQSQKVTFWNLNRNQNGKAHFNWLKGRFALFD